MSLSDTREELIDSIQENLSVLLNRVSIAKVGRELEEAALWLEALGICNLLIYGDTDRFYEHLIRSGHVRRYFLTRSEREGHVNDYQFAISRWDSFLDVVAVGHFSLAREIVSLSAIDLVAAGEYEDDFCCRYFMHQFIGPPSPTRDHGLQSTRARWRGWLGALASIRFDLCAALASEDEQAFAVSFDQLIAARRAEVVRHRRMALAAEITFEPRSLIYVEGLAFLRLAERLGFETRSDYPMCPALARLPPSKALPDDMFVDIDAARDSGSSGDS